MCTMYGGSALINKSGGIHSIKWKWVGGDRLIMNAARTKGLN